MPKESVVRFRTRVLQARKTATGIEVPAAAVEALGAGKWPKVTVTINGCTYRSSIALERHPRAKRAFEALSYSRQQRYTLPIEKAKTDDTRDRNVHKAIRELQKG